MAAKHPRHKGKPRHLATPRKPKIHSATAHARIAMPRVHAPGWWLSARVRAAMNWADGHYIHPYMQMLILAMVPIIPLLLLAWAWSLVF